MLTGPQSPIFHTEPAQVTRDEPSTPWVALMTALQGNIEAVPLSSATLDEPCSARVCQLRPHQQL